MSDTATMLPSRIRISGAGTDNAPPSSPSASIVSAGPESPSGRQRPTAARRRMVTVSPSRAPAERVLSFANTRSMRSSPAAATTGIEATPSSTPIIPVRTNRFTMYPTPSLESPA